MKFLPIARQKIENSGRGKKANVHKNGFGGSGGRKNEGLPKKVELGGNSKE